MSAGNIYPYLSGELMSGSMHTAENLPPAAGGGAAPTGGGSLGEMFQSLSGNVTTAMLTLNTALQEVN